MTNSAVFNDIELFGIIPSSNCNVNEDLYSFMDQIRCLKGIQPVKRKYPEEYTNTQKIYYYAIHKKTRTYQPFT